MKPQLLSHAIMTFGFLAFLGARSRGRGYVMPVVVMAFAGFVKPQHHRNAPDCFHMACNEPSARSR